MRHIEASYGLGIQPAAALLAALLEEFDAMNRSPASLLSALAILAPMLVSACAVAPTFTRTNDAPASHRTPEQVQIFTAGPPSQPYLERGVISIEVVNARYQQMTSVEGLIAEMRDAGAANGCDAVVALTPIAASQTHGGTATCIVFK